MTKGARAVAVAMVLVAGVLLTAPLWRSGGTGAAAQEHGQAQAAIAGVPATSARPDPGDTPLPAAAGRTSATLPALDAPLRLVVDDLRRRADAGDPAAACRIAAEFEYCRNAGAHLRHWQVHRDRMESGAGTVQEDAIADFAQMLAKVDERLEQANKVVAHCAGVDLPDGGRRARYWRTAALGEHPAAARHYAIGNAFQFEDLLTAVPELDLYRREAEGIARRAALAGDPALMFALAMAYTPREDTLLDTGPTQFQPFLAQVIEPDPAQALAWLHALQAHPVFRQLPDGHPTRRNAKERFEQLAGQQGPGVVATATARAEAWVRAWPPQPPGPTRFDTFGNGLLDIGREDCAPGG